MAIAFEPHRHVEGKSYAYVRISTRDQNETRQIRALEEYHIPESQIYIDRQSGKDFDRPEYQRMLSRLDENDILYIKSIDRLGRNYLEIQEQWRYLTQTLKVDIVVLDMPILDTRLGKDLLGTFLSDIVLQVLSFVAQNERENIRQRQAEGIAAAKIRGIRFGRPAIPLPPEFGDYVYAWHEGRMSCADAAARSGVSQSTFRKRARDYISDNPEQFDTDYGTVVVNQVEDGALAMA